MAERDEGLRWLRRAIELSAEAREIEDESAAIQDGFWD